MEGCNGTCIMESRIVRLESRLDEQATRYADSQTEAAERMTRMEGNIDKLLQGQDDMNAMLTTVLNDKQQEDIEKARNSNKAAASKWNNLSESTKTLIKIIVTAIITSGVAWLIAKYG